MISWINERITPARVIIVGFLLLILLGTGLLMLPWATQSGEGASFLDALFTATSATCVTGLVVQDTATYWSAFGQAVILLLIQTGGMGVVTVAVAVTMVSGKKISLKQRWVMQESISAPQVGGIVRMTGFILRVAIAIEAIGAVILSLRFIPELGPVRGLWNGIFHSISAFCNAGFDLQGVNAPYSSLTGFTGDPVVNLTVILLIVLGGIGFLTWEDVYQHKFRISEYRLQSKLVLAAALVLITLPALFFYFYELQQPAWAALSTGERIWGALFQSVTTRTAGFNTIDLCQFQETSLMLMIFLMLVGGSPGSTAGGFKTTTLVVLILNVAAVFRKKEHPQAFGRRLPPDILRNASAIFMLYLILCLVGGGLISCIDNLPLLPCLFESASAIATVGLSLGLTPGLSTASHVILIFLMYCGRVGGLTLIFAVISAYRTPAQLPQERITVG